MLDRILEIDDKHITAIRNSTVNEEWVVATGRYVMPDTLVLEAMVQAAGALAIFEGKYTDYSLMSVDKAKFHDKITPGDAMKVTADCQPEQHGEERGFSCAVHVDGNMVAAAFIKLRMLL